MMRYVALLEEPMILLVLGFALFGTGALARWHMNNLLEREEMGHHPLQWTERAYVKLMRERRAPRWPLVMTVICLPAGVILAFLGVFL
jgi:hypothetical protein